MGLDMYLEKVKRSDGVTIGMLEAIDNHYCYINRPEKYKNSTMAEWCGGNEKNTPDESILKQYESEYIHRYSSWDTEHKYGFTTIFQNIAYWRKANQIHKWFVNNVQGGVDNCSRYEVDKSTLKNLLDVCETVLNSIKLKDGIVKNGETLIDNKWVPIYEKGKIIEDSSIAEELLPSSIGFFFGSPDYNEWYYDDVKYTYDTIKGILETTDFDKEMVLYSASW